MSDFPPNPKPLGRHLPRWLSVSGWGVIVATAGCWAAMGCHLGWSQDRRALRSIDAVTGLEHITYEDRFLPGVDALLGATVVSAVLLLSAAFLRHRNRTH
jgi:hypothetical protein